MWFSGTSALTSLIASFLSLVDPQAEFLFLYFIDPQAEFLFLYFIDPQAEFLFLQ